MAFPSRWTCALVILALAGQTSNAQAPEIKDTKGVPHLQGIGDALDSADHHPVHILYMHGIDQIGAGDSARFRESICNQLKLCQVSDWKNAGIEYPDKGEFDPAVQPPALAYLGSPIWTSADEWHAAAPFVVHWVVHLRGHPAVLVVDEINWWPLVMAIKCRNVMTPEAHLAGPDSQLIDVCSLASKQDPDGLGRFYPWIQSDEAARLKKLWPHSVRINRNLKSSLVDWGLSDVLMAVGPMGGLLRDGVRQLMAKSAAFAPTGTGAALSASGTPGAYDWRSQLNQDKEVDQEFIGVTHSLGSYLLFNTLSVENSNAANLSAQESARVANEENAVRYIFERTALMYFFANQLEMLDITNLENAPRPTPSPFKSRGPAPAPLAPMTPASNFGSLVNKWKQMQGDFQSACHPNDETARKNIQVVAFNDPSDVITFRVPKIGDVDVVNLNVKNATRWFGLFESPSAAHGNYAKNLHVLRMMFEGADGHVAR